MARLLDPRAFGVVAFASVAVAFLSIFVQQGFGQALVQVPNLEKRHLDTAFWVSIVFGCVLTFTVFALSRPLARLFHLPEVAPVLQVLSFGFVLTALASTQVAILQRQMAFRSLAIRLILGNLVGAIVGVVAAAAGAGVWSLVAQTLSGAAVGVLVVWTASPWRPGFSVTADTWRELFRFGRNVLGGNIAGFFLRRTDDFFIGAFLGPVLLGVYTVAFRLLVVLMDVSTDTVERVALPIFARLQGDDARLKKAYFAATRMSAAVALPLFCFMIAAAPEVIHVFFGTHWDRSVPVMRVLSLMGVTSTLTNFNYTLMTAVGRPNLAFRLLIVASISNVIGVAIAVHWGIVAVATALLLRNVLVGSPLSVYGLRRVLEVGYAEYLLSYATPAVASIFAMGSVVVLHLALLHIAGNVVRLAVMLPTAAVVYLAALWLLDARLLRELAEHAGSLRRREGRLEV